MREDGHRDRSCSFETIDLGDPPPGCSAYLATRWDHSYSSVIGADCLLPSPLQTPDHQYISVQDLVQEKPDKDCSVDVDAPPPLGVELTGYRLVFMATVFCFGTVKIILAYVNQSIAPTTFDWVAGTFLAIL